MPGIMSEGSVEGTAPRCAWHVRFPGSEYGASAPGETAAMMQDKLRFHTDLWDLSVDLRAGLPDIVVIAPDGGDARLARSPSLRAH